MGDAPSPYYPPSTNAPNAGNVPFVPLDIDTADESSSQQFTQSNPFLLELQGESLELDPEYLLSKRSRKRRKPVKKKKQKKALTSYNLFYQEQLPNLLATHGNMAAPEIASRVGNMWRNLTPEQKRPYQAKAAELKKEFLLAAEQASSSSDEDDQPPHKRARYTDECAEHVSAAKKKIRYGDLSGAIADLQRALDVQTEERAKKQREKEELERQQQMREEQERAFKAKATEAILAAHQAFAFSLVHASIAEDSSPSPGPSTLLWPSAVPDKSTASPLPQWMQYMQMADPAQVKQRRIDVQNMRHRHFQQIFHQQKKSISSADSQQDSGSEAASNIPISSEELYDFMNKEL